MITRAGRELVETCGPMEKDAWIADRLSTRMLRGVGNLLRTSSIPMKALYHGAKAVGKGAGARGLEWAGDAMRKYPVRTAYIGIPAVYGAHKLQSSLDRNLNNINSNNPYMSA